MWTTGKTCDSLTVRAMPENLRLPHEAYPFPWDLAFSDVEGCVYNLITNEFKYSSLLITYHTYISKATHCSTVSAYFIANGAIPLLSGSQCHCITAQKLLTKASWM